MSAAAKVERAQQLHETFRAYVTASNEALRVYMDYKFGLASEQRVAAANQIEALALDAHIAAIGQVTS